MTYLEELEKKVMQIINKNRDMAHRVSALEAENIALREKTQQMETSLLRESCAAEELRNEKATMKNSIELLLSSIKTLEEKAS
ncbi:hypothetical protein K2W90_03915 [Candidatus Babeliales bacterium]|nr:hypothetical protein [Candidatus Babeliales bacterium]